MVLRANALPDPVLGLRAGVGARASRASVLTRSRQR